MKAAESIIEEMTPITVRALAHFVRDALAERQSA
jgi:hypothetical protein